MSPLTKSMIKDDVGGDFFIAFCIGWTWVMSRCRKYKK